jgi:phosphatidylglycerophosphatase C
VKTKHKTPKNAQKALILFDFDGTITSRDSFWHFLRFTKGDFSLFVGLVLVTLKQVFSFGRFDNSTLKAAILSHFFKGFSENELMLLGEKYFNARMTLILKPEILLKIESYKNENAEIALVSASIDCWLLPFAQAHNMKLICTELKYENGIFTGYFATPNCNHEEKATRIKEHFNLEGYTKIVAYGNSKGDLAMFGLANEYFWV